jgi:hypothetical protein
VDTQVRRSEAAGVADRDLGEDEQQQEAEVDRDAAEPQRRDEAAEEPHRWVGDGEDDLEQDEQHARGTEAPAERHDEVDDEPREQQDQEDVEQRDQDAAEGRDDAS